MSEPQHPGSSGTAPAPERQTTPFLVLQFFIFPMAIVAVCVTVFVVFGLIASEGKSARDYLGEVRSGSANRRWQAAFELSKALLARKDPALADPGFVAELVALFEESGNDDPRVRRYLALTLGRLADPRAVPALLDALRPADAGASDSETQIYAIWALGAIRDPAALPELDRLAQSDDPGMRKAATHALGAFAGPKARAALLRALSDATADVRWNGALALARRAEPAAIPVLLQMLDRKSLSQVPGLGEDQREEALLAAVQVSTGSRDPTLRAALEALRASDPSLRVREAARVALEQRH